MLERQKDIYAEHRNLEREAEMQRKQFEREFDKQTERLTKEEVEALYALHEQYNENDEGCPVDPDVLKSSASIFSRLEDTKKREKYAQKAYKIRQLSEGLARELMKILQDD